MISLKWRIKAWGHIPTFVSTIWELSKCSPNMGPRTSHVLPKCFKKSRTIPNRFYKEIWLRLLESSQLETFEIGYQHVWDSGVWELCFFDIELFKTF